MIKFWGSNVVDLKRLSVADINAMSKKKLQEILVRLKLSKSGNVAELKNRVIDAITKLAEVGCSASTAGPGDSGTGTGAAATTSIGAEEPASTGTGAGAASRKKKKWRVTDPAEIAPNYYHKDLFTANFPLVDVVEIDEGCPFPVRDKFEGEVLDPEATQEARQLWIRRLHEVEREYKTPENETQAFPVHFGFLEPLALFTRPSRADIAKHNQNTRKRKWTSEAVDKELKRRRNSGECVGKAGKGGDEENSGMYIVPDSEQVQGGPLGPNRSSGDNSGMKITPAEAAELHGPVLEDEDIPTGFADGVLHVFDERKGNECKLITSDRIAGVLERKFAEDKHKWNARYQGGFYAVKYLILNLHHGHFSPVYVLVMTSSMWSYGILVPEGYVQVRNGKVYEPSMNAFYQHQQSTGVSEMDYEKLQEKLSRGTEFYRTCFKDNPQAVYRDGPMLVGKFYLSKEWLSLPKPQAYGDAAEGVHRLFDGLMRLVLGDSVCNMSEEDLYWRVHLRKTMEEERVQSFFPQPKTAWAFDHIRDEVARSLNLR